MVGKVQSAQQPVTQLQSHLLETAFKHGFYSAHPTNPGLRASSFSKAQCRNYKTNSRIVHQKPYCFKELAKNPLLLSSINPEVTEWKDTANEPAKSMKCN